MHSPDEYDRNETFDDPGFHDEHTLGQDYHPDSLPSAEYALNLWSPSLYQAAQYAYPASLPLRQLHNIPSVDRETPPGESWQSPNTVVPSHREDNQSHVQSWMNGMSQLHRGSVFEMSPLDRGSSSTLDDAGPPVSGDGKAHGCTKPKAANKKTSLRCLICADGTSFTGQYAQRNLNRHMEKHNSCGGASSRRHIRCGQPGCTSAFGREDALLVHLRRSHPELNTPPAKKRKRDE